MKKDTTSARLVLRCYTKSEYGYAHVMFYPMLKQPTGKIEGMGFEGVANGLFLNDLELSDQIDDHNGRNDGQHDYAWSAYFKPSRVELREAQAIVKTLTTLDKRLEKMREQFGYVKSYGEFVCRVANALGAVAIVFDSMRFPGEVQELLPGHAIDRINKEVEIQWRKLTGQAEPETAAA